MRPPQRRYTREQVVQVGRWAWGSSRGDDEPDLYFDGVAFWNGRQGEARALATAESVPADGWWHANECHCELCRPASQRE